MVGDARTLPSGRPGSLVTIERRRRALADRHRRPAAPIDVRVAREHGTVDILSADDPRRGAFTRVVPNGAGSEYLFTLFFPATVGEDAVAAQMAVVDAELRAVRELCETP